MTGGRGRETYDASARFSVSHTVCDALVTSDSAKLIVFSAGRPRVSVQLKTPCREKCRSWPTLWEAFCATTSFAASRTSLQPSARKCKPIPPQRRSVSSKRHPYHLRYTHTNICRVQPPTVGAVSVYQLACFYSHRLGLRSKSRRAAVKLRGVAGRRKRRAPCLQVNAVPVQSPSPQPSPQATTSAISPDLIDLSGLVTCSKSPSQVGSEVMSQLWFATTSARCSEHIYAYSGALLYPFPEISSIQDTNKTELPLWLPRTYTT